jgi:hypothetical protein
MKYLKKFQNNTTLKTYKKFNFITPHVYLDSNLNTVKYMEEYKQLEYISSTQTGGQYIDLGCHLLENTDGIQMDIKFNIKDRGLNSSNQQGTLICSQPEVSPYPGFVLRYAYADERRWLQLQAKWQFSESLHFNGKYYYKYLTHTANYSENLVPDNIIYEFSIPLDNIPSSQVNNCTCTLFCALDGSNNPFRYVEADLYYLKFTKGGQVIRNLIPVKKVPTNEIGLYDMENDHFYVSQGNDPFVAGPNK